MRDIEYPDRYRAKIESHMHTPCRRERCPKCGKFVGKAIKKDGTTYLAELVDSGQESDREISSDYADKRQPHFKTCTKILPPDVVVKGVRARVVKGRVPLGTEGIIIWIGFSNYGERCGLKDDQGQVFWTALSNVVRVTEQGPA